MRLSQLGSAGEHFGESKVAELGVAIAIEEDVGGFDVSMQDGFYGVALNPSVACLEREHELSQHAPDHVLLDFRAERAIERVSE